MTNPDYPTNVGDFSSHTYQPTQPVYNNFYYGGMGSMQIPQQFQPDSRRNEPSPVAQQPQMNPYGYQFNPQNPMASFNALYANSGYGASYSPMPQLPASEMNIRPFSSYPPEYSVPQNQFNVTTDSRRMDSSTQNNPWAVPAPNPFAQPQAQSIPQYINPAMDCSSMYGQMNVPQYSRKTPQWDNTYTQPQQTQMPNIDWSMQNNPYANNPTYPQAAPAYPQINMAQPQTPNESWLNIAQQNWK